MDAADILLSTFREESEELVERLARLLESLPQRSSEEQRRTSQEAMRVAHTIKGNAVAVGHEELVVLAHSLEDTLASLAHHTETLPEAQCLALINAAISMQDLISPARLALLRAALIAGLNGQASAQDTGRLRAKQPASTSPDARDDLSSAVDETTSPTNLDMSPPTDGQATSEKSPLPLAEADVRVKTERLDSLMSFTGEILVSHARMTTRNDELHRFSQALDAALEELGVDQDSSQEILAILGEVIQRDRRELLDFGHLTQELNLAMKQVRMMPIRALEPFLRKTIRSSARDLGKRIELTVEVGDLEIDKQILDRIREPLLHLLRNCISHGIGSPEQRVRTGKAELGQILFRAETQGSMVRLEISDDGEGIDTDQVAAIAEVRGLLQGKHTSKAELLELLFQPGFSTAKAVDRLSGRGVGLDSVRQSIERLGGSVQIATAPTLGGTTIYLTLPSSVLSIIGVLVQASQEVFAIPIEHVRRTLVVNRDTVRTVDGEPTIVPQDDEPLRLRWLHQLFGDRPDQEREKLTILVLSYGERLIGAVVDKILGEKELVSKPLPWNLTQVSGISGAIILPDGAVALLIDVGTLFDADLGRDIDHGTRGAAGRGAVGARILVVDDSLTTRTLQRNILASAGYDVSVAVDGEDAWRRLLDERFELIVTDIQMPKLDGIRLTQRIRATDSLRQLPVVLVSSLGSEEDITRGLEVGANEYVVKGAFDQTHLLEAVNRLL